MIQMQSNVLAIDNSGMRYAQCIKTLTGFNRKKAYNGDFILVSIKKIKLVRQVKKGEIHLAVLVKTKKETKYKDGTLSKFGSNSVILLNQKKRILGTRIFGWVSRNLRKKKFLRILLLSGWKII